MFRYHLRLFSTFLWVTLIALSFNGPQPTQAASSYSMGTGSSYHIRFDAASTAGKLGYAGLTTGDLDGDGLPDLVMGERLADNNSRTNSGSLYIILGSKLATTTGLGNNISLSNSANWNIRIDMAAGDEGGRSPQIADVDNDGKMDLLFANYRADNNGSNSGSIFVLRNTLLQPYLTSTTGQTIDITDTSKFNYRFDGAAAGNQVAWVRTGDVLGNDGKNDLVIGTLTNTDKTYIINNTLFSGTSGTGNTYNLATSSNYNIIYRGLFPLDNDPIGDLNNDGKMDLLFSDSSVNYKGRGINTGAIFGIYNALINANVGTGNSIDASLSNNYNFIIGAVGPSLFGDWNSTQIGDVNSDGKNDIVASGASIDSLTFPGYTYVLYNDLINLSGTGNDIDLATSSNWNIRFNGAANGDWHVRGAMARIAQLDNKDETTQDLVFSAVGNAVGEAAHPGKVYVSLDGKLNYTGTGNSVNLSDTSKYSFRYDGASASDWLSANGLELSDMNNDGQKDVVMSAWGTASESGSVYLIYYFPHTITASTPADYVNTTITSITGRVQAPNDTVNISAIEFRNEEGGAKPDWTSCTATDGTFNSKDEEYSCAVPTATDGHYHIHIRAQDEKGVYTTHNNHPERMFMVDLTAPSVDVTTIAPTYNAKVTLSGTITDMNLASVTLNGNSLTLNSDGSFETTIDTPNSTTATLVATDRAGNTTTKTLDITRYYHATLSNDGKTFTFHPVGGSAISYSKTDVLNALKYGKGKRAKDNAIIKVFQTVLKDLGFFAPTPTGFFGSQTRTAVKKFQESKSLKSTGLVDSRLLAMLSDVPLSDTRYVQPLTQGKKWGLTETMLKEAASAKITETPKSNRQSVQARFIQQKLYLLGYYSGPMHGWFNSSTQAAVRAYRKARNIGLGLVDTVFRNYINGV